MKVKYWIAALCILGLTLLLFYVCVSFFSPLIYEINLFFGFVPDKINIGLFFKTIFPLAILLSSILNLLLVVLLLFIWKNISQPFRNFLILFSIILVFFSLVYNTLCYTNIIKTFPKKEVVVPDTDY